MARLLSVIPWVASQDGASVDEISRRFEYPRDQLLRDLDEVLFFVGVHPFTPDTLIDVEISDERVHIRYADWFSKPLRLSADDAARLTTAGRTVLAINPDADEAEAGPLLRALAKLDLTLGDSAGQSVEVRLGDAPEATLDVLRAAAEEGRQVELDYYTYGRDELTHRAVDPARVFSDQGHWYMSGWCYRADDERVFRVDRIRHVTITDRKVEADLPRDVTTSFTPSGDDPRVALRLSPGAAWVASHYPVESRTDNDDGTIDVSLAVTAEPWLARLLVRLGPDVTVLDRSAEIPADLAKTTALRILERYRG